MAKTDDIDGGDASTRAAHRLFEQWADVKISDGVEPDLDRLCAEAPELRSRVEALIRGFHDLDQLLPAADDGAGPEAPEVSGYAIGELIGEGGMGEVWRAEQLRPVRRGVALKVLKRGFNLDRAQLRFEFERQAQAGLDHPAIARIYDAGVAEDGRPFFSMEPVDGLPINAYCDRHRLPVRRRLELFVQVCEGVLYAHRRGLIHRDLKPSNILVAEVDGGPQPKIIDFGIAKVIQGPGDSPHAAAPQTLTELGQLVGTPAYMSPEQASPLRTSEIDTRSDVYSLGVVLFELLVGQRPRAAWAEDGDADRGEPPTPSTHISQLGAHAEDIARARGVPLPRLQKLLRGDVDWIVLKALEPRRQDRYGSPAELAEDLRRHFRDEPVWAGPTGLAYRTKKLIRRHRTAVGAGVLALMVLLGTVAGLGVGLRRALEAEKTAREESALAESTSEFLVTLFDGTDPTSFDPSPTARALLDRGAARLDSDLADQPRHRVRMLESIGRAYQGLGALDEAAVLLREALDFRRQDSATDGPTLATTLHRLADVLSARGELDAAKGLAEEALELRLADAPDGLSAEVADLQQQLGVIAERAGEFERAEQLYADVLTTREALFGEKDLSLGGTLNNLGNMTARRGDVEPAEALFTRALDLYTEHLGPEHPHVASTLNNLAIMKGHHGGLEEAVELHGRVLEIRRAALAPDHPDLGETYNNLGVALTDLGRLDEALEMTRESLEIRRKVYGTEHFLYASAAFNLGRIELVREALGPARRYLTEAKNIFERTLGPEHAYVSYPLQSLSKVNRLEGRIDIALQQLEECVEIRLKTLDEGHPFVQGALVDIEKILRELGRAEDADRIAARIVPQGVEINGDDGDEGDEGDEATS